MGEEASQWVSQFLGLDGCRLYYMAPRHRARVLKQDHQWDDITRHGEEVTNICLLSCAHGFNTSYLWKYKLYICECK